VAGYEYAPAGQVEWQIDNNAPPDIARAVTLFMTIQAFLFKPVPDETTVKRIAVKIGLPITQVEGIASKVAGTRRTLESQRSKLTDFGVVSA
jgi:hypothetical protein